MDVETKTVIRAGMTNDDYLTAAAGIIKANQGIAASGDPVVSGQARIARGLVDSGSAYDRLVRSLMPAIAAQTKFAQGMETVIRAVEGGRDPLNLAGAAVDALTKKYGIISQAALDSALKIAAANEAATKASVTQAAYGAYAGVKPMLDSTDYASRAADIAAYGAAMDKVKASYNPLFAAAQAYDAMLQKITADVQAGAIAENEAAIARQQAAATYQAAMARNSAYAVQIDPQLQAAAYAQQSQAAYNAFAVRQPLNVQGPAGAAPPGVPPGPDDYTNRAADIAAYGKAMDDLRASINPTFAASQTLDAELAKLDLAVRTGAVSEAEAADGRLKALDSYRQTMAAIQAQAKAQADLTEQSNRSLLATKDRLDPTAQAGENAYITVGSKPPPTTPAEIAAEAANTKAREADTAAYGASLDALRAKYDPLFAASKKYEATVNELNTAMKTGAFGQGAGAQVIYDKGLAQANQDLAETEQVAGRGGRAMTDLSLTTAASTREFIVLGHEIVTGQWTRIPGSLIVLGERLGGLGELAKGLKDFILTVPGAFTALAVVGVGAMTAIAVAAEITSRQMLTLQNNLNATGASIDAAGVRIAAKDVSRTTPGVGTTAAMDAGTVVADNPAFQGTSQQLANLIKLGQQLSMSVKGMDLQQAMELFSKGMQDAGSVAQQLLDKDHLKGLNQAMVDLIKVTQISDPGKAFNLLAQAVADSTAHSIQNITPLQQALADLDKAFNGADQSGKTFSQQLGSPFLTAGVNAVKGFTAAINDLRDAINLPISTDNFLQKALSTYQAVARFLPGSIAFLPGQMGANLSPLLNNFRTPPSANDNGGSPVLGPQITHQVSSGVVTEQAVGAMGVLPTSAADYGHSIADISTIQGNVNAAIDILSHFYSVAKHNIADTVALYSGNANNPVGAARYNAKLAAVDPSALDPAVQAAITAALQKRALDPALADVLRRIPGVETAQYGGAQYLPANGKPVPVVVTGSVLTGGTGVTTTDTAARNLAQSGLGSILPVQITKNLAEQQQQQAGIDAALRAQQNAKSVGDDAGYDAAGQQVQNFTTRLQDLEGASYKLVTVQQASARSADLATKQYDVEAGAARDLFAIQQKYALMADETGHIDTISEKKEEAAVLATLAGKLNDVNVAADRNTQSQLRMVPAIEQGGRAAQLAADQQKAFIEADQYAPRGTPAWTKAYQDRLDALTRATVAGDEVSAASTAEQQNQARRLAQTQLDMIQQTQYARDKAVAQEQARASLHLAPGDTPNPEQQRALDAASAAFDAQRHQAASQQIEDSSRLTAAENARTDAVEKGGLTAQLRAAADKALEETRRLTSGPSDPNFGPELARQTATAYQQVLAANSTANAQIVNSQTEIARQAALELSAVKETEYSRGRMVTIQKAYVAAGLQPGQTPNAEQARSIAATVGAYDDQARTAAAQKVADINRQTEAQNRQIPAIMAGGRAAQQAADAEAARTAIDKTAGYGMAQYTLQLQAQKDALEGLAQSKYNAQAAATIAQTETENDTLTEQVNLLDASVEVRNREMAVLNARRALNLKPGEEASNALQQQAIDDVATYTDRLTVFQQKESAIQSISGGLSSAFDTVGNSIVTAFVTGNSAGVTFASVLASVAEQIAQLILKMAVINPLINSMFPSAGLPTLGGLFSTVPAASGTAGIDALAGLPALASAANPSGLPPFAKGDALSAAGLAPYRNTIVDTPTVFRFATGTGLMGEAGPEAIMPLTRGPSGSLGVRASGAGTNVQINTPITVNAANSNGKPMDAATMRALQSQLDQTVRQAVRATITDERRSGGQLSR